MKKNSQKKSRMRKNERTKWVGEQKCKLHSKQSAPIPLWWENIPPVCPAGFTHTEYCHNAVFLQWWTTVHFLFPSPASECAFTHSVWSGCCEAFTVCSGQQRCGGNSKSHLAWLSLGVIIIWTMSICNLRRCLQQALLLNGEKTESGHLGKKPPL